MGTLSNIGSKGRTVSKIQVNEFSNLKELQDVTRFLSKYAAELNAIVNGRLEFGVNLWTYLVSWDFQAANTSYPVPHQLGRMPQGYIQVQSSAATSLFDGTGTNTSGLIYLKSSAVAQVSFLVF